MRKLRILSSDGIRIYRCADANVDFAMYVGDAAAVTAGESGVAMENKRPSLVAMTRAEATALREELARLLAYA